MKKSVMVAVLAVLAVTGLTVLAQEQGPGPGAGRRPGGGGPRVGGGEVLGRILDRLATDPKMAEDLGLTAEQVGKLKAKADELKAGRDDVMAKLQAADEKQRALMQADPLDEAALVKGLEEVGALRIEMAKQDLKALIAARAILTPEQLKKVREQARERIQGAVGERRQQRRGAEGRGGNTPPPPPPPPPPAE